MRLRQLWTSAASPSGMLEKMPAAPWKPAIEMPRSRCKRYCVKFSRVYRCCKPAATRWTATASATGSKAPLRPHWSAFTASSTKPTTQPGARSTSVPAKTAVRTLWNCSATVAIQSNIPFVPRSSASSAFRKRAVKSANNSWQRPMAGRRMPLTVRYMCCFPAAS
ncbi:hypothetical protein D9M70_502290 [compost metagenome]